MTTPTDPPPYSATAESDRQDKPGVPTFYVQRWESDYTSWEDWMGAGVGAGPYTAIADAHAAISRIRQMWTHNRVRCFRVVERRVVNTQIGEPFGPVTQRDSDARQSEQSAPSEQGQS